MNSPQVNDIAATFLHVRDGGSAGTVSVSDAFWESLAKGQYPELDQGRLMTAFTFSEPWASWERHPAGEELVMLLSGAATVILEVAGAEQTVELSEVGTFVLVPPKTWHTVRATVPTKMLFLTPGAGTEHRPV